MTSEEWNKLIICEQSEIGKESISDAPEADCIIEFKKYYGTTNILDKVDNLLREKSSLMRDDITLERLATEIGTNRTYLSRAIRERNGFVNYMNRQRIQYIYDLLEKNRNMNMDEALERAGFKSMKSFIKRLDEHKDNEIANLLKKKYLYRNEN